MMTKNQNNLCFLFLALAVAFSLMPLLTQSVSAAEQVKTLHIQVVDDETGRKVAGADCTVETNTNRIASVTTNAGGQASATLNNDVTSATIFCLTGAGSGSTSVTLNERGITRATVVL